MKCYDKLLSTPKDTREEKYDVFADSAHLYYKKTGSTLKRYVGIDFGYTPATDQKGLREEMSELLKSYVYGYCCGKCGGGGMDADRTCSACGGHGIVDWQTTKLAEKLEAIITAKVEEAREEERKRILEEAEKTSFVADIVHESNLIAISDLIRIVNNEQ